MRLCPQSKFGAGKVLKGTYRVPFLASAIHHGLVRPYSFFNGRDQITILKRSIMPGDH